MKIRFGSRRRGFRHVLVSLIACSVCTTWFATAVSAAIFTVTTTNDSGGGSLRDAITQANAAAGEDRIEFQAGVNGVIAPATDLPLIIDSLIIAGPGARNLTISGGNARRVLNSAAALTISGLRLANGFTDRGAGIAFNADALLSVSDCHFDQNTVTNEGGAITLLAGSLKAERCTFTTCQAAGSGGVIWYGQGVGSPTATITNCTFVNNFASNSGGAIRQFNSTAYASTITNCTFVVNNAGSAGGAIAVNGGTMGIRNCLFTANAAGGNPGGHLIDQVGGTITSLGHNLFGHLDGANFPPDPTDKFGTVPSQLNTGVLIAFPFNNGGLTDTVPLLGASIAIDGGSATGAPSTDQRGLSRVGCSPDVGAFEVQTVTDTDGDGVINCLDACPNTPACASVNQSGCPTDGDADGVADGCDQCLNTLAGDAVNVNGCSTADEDGDGVTNDADACKGTPDCALASVDASGCPADADGDGLFDGCDQCPGANDLADTDVDGIPDCLDACLADGDSDADGVQDCQDGCPADALKFDPGICGCGTAEVDTDSDGVVDCVDACPGTPACALVNETGCSIDSDGDSVADGCDQSANTPAGDPVAANGFSMADEDNDGVLNDVDACHGTPACAIASVGANGCPADADGDGLFDGCDQCPNDDDLVDTDGDAIPDCLDACPNDIDSDGDGVQDCQDACPADPQKRDHSICGCGEPDTDNNGNGIPDCVDPDEPAPQAETPKAEPEMGLQTFVALGPVFPGGLVCGVGLAGPMFVLSLFLVGARWSKRRIRRRG